MRVKKLLAQLSAKVSVYPWSKELNNLRIFPGGSPVVLKRYQALVVPDRWEMSKAFKSGLPWHDLDRDEIEQLKPLFSAIEAFRSKTGVKSMFLSQRVAEWNEHADVLRPDEKYEATLKNKAKYICR